HDPLLTRAVAPKTNGIDEIDTPRREIGGGFDLTAHGRIRTSSCANVDRLATRASSLDRARVPVPIAMHADVPQACVLHGAGDRDRLIAAELEDQVPPRSEPVGPGSGHLLEERGPARAAVESSPRLVRQDVPRQE